MVFCVLHRTHSEFDKIQKCSYASLVDDYQDDYDIFRVNSCLKLLNKNWEEFQQNHEFIVSKKSDNKVTEPLLDHTPKLDHFVNLSMKYNNMLNNKDRQRD